MKERKKLYKEVIIMTLRDLTSQLHRSSVGGRFNGEKFTKGELQNYIVNALRIKNRWVMEITLPDGDWLFTIERFSDAPDGFGYYIPETREQESRIWESLINEQG